MHHWRFALSHKALERVNSDWGVVDATAGTGRAFGESELTFAQASRSLLRRDRPLRRNRGRATRWARRTVRLSQFVTDTSGLLGENKAYRRNGLKWVLKDQHPREIGKTDRVASPTLTTDYSRLCIAL